MLRIPGLPLLPALLLGGGVAAVVGVLFGLPSLRIKGFYLAVATLAAQFFIEWALTKFGWFSNYSSSGVISAPALEVFGLPLDTPASKYLFTLSVVAVMALAAIREADISAAQILVFVMIIGVRGPFTAGWSIRNPASTDRSD